MGGKGYKSNTAWTGLWSLGGKRENHDEKGLVI